MDLWKVESGWLPIGEYLVEGIERYFSKQDLSLYVPGKMVAFEGAPIHMRMVLISLGKSDPYKVFYRIEDNQVHIYIVRHPYQKPLT